MFLATNALVYAACSRTFFFLFAKCTITEQVPFPCTVSPFEQAQSESGAAVQSAAGCNTASGTTCTTDVTQESTQEIAAPASMDAEVMQAEVEGAAAVALVQTEGVLLRAGVLVRLYEALLRELPAPLLVTGAAEMARLAGAPG